MLVEICTQTRGYNKVKKLPKSGIKYNSEKNTKYSDNVDSAIRGIHNFHIRNSIEKDKAVLSMVQWIQIPQKVNGNLCGKSVTFMS